MRKAAPRPLAIPASVLLSIMLILPAMTSQTALANIQPEAAILVHVRPPGEPCVPAVTTCDQIVRSTTEWGLQEFQLFVYPVAYQYWHFPIRYVEFELFWPPAWEPVDVAYCESGIGTLEVLDPDHYRFRIEWPDCPPITGQIFMAMRIVMDVWGPGRLEFANPYQVPLGLGCGQDAFDAHTFGVFAEAGMDCDYTRYTCAESEECTPYLSENRLDLTAPMGQIAQGSLHFSVYDFDQVCDLTAGSEDTWATAEILPAEPPWGKWLQVTADARDLDEGIYHTWVRVGEEDLVARCVYVNFVVERTASAPEITGRTRQTGSWGRIKALYR